MLRIEGVVKGVLIGADGQRVELPMSSRAVPKPKRTEGGAQKMEGIVPNGTFGTDGRGLTIGEMGGEEDVLVAVADGRRFVETAMGTTDTQVVAVEMPKRRNIINLKRHGL